jgi:TM2 domain-containing membrane protein YozV
MSFTISHCLPELDEPERSFIERLTIRMSETDIRQFAVAYRQARKDPQLVLLMAVIGIVAVPGLHRFALGQVGLGFLYLLTYGLLLFGTIADIINHKELAFRYNRQLAQRIASNLLRPRSPLATQAASKGGEDHGLFSQRQYPA